MPRALIKVAGNAETRSRTLEPAEAAGRKKEGMLSDEAGHAFVLLKITVKVLPCLPRRSRECTRPLGGGVPSAGDFIPPRAYLARENTDYRCNPRASTVARAPSAIKARVWGAGEEGMFKRRVTSASRGGERENSRYPDPQGRHAQRDGPWNRARKREREREKRRAGSWDRRGPRDRKGVRGGCARIERARCFRAE